MPHHHSQRAEHEAGNLPTGSEERSAEVQKALATLLALAETLDELELDDVEPAFGSLEWP